LKEKPFHSEKLNLILPLQGDAKYDRIFKVLRTEFWPSEKFEGMSRKKCQISKNSVRHLEKLGIKPTPGRRPDSVNSAENASTILKEWLKALLTRPPRRSNTSLPEQSELS
jgi:hypothetical protein